ncbi:MAG: hypothetical protein ACPG4T_18710 [Nannocystaceae bacterium]
MTNDASDLELLLSDAEEYLPVLDDGIPADVLGQAPPPSRGPKGAQSMHLDAPDRDPNELPAQRWGVIAPEGPLGDELLDAVAALIEHRGQQQDCAPTIYRVPPGMGAVDAMRWKNGVYRSEDVPEDERPRYLMMLGDLHEVSLDLQHILANGSFVGRVQCPDVAGFRNYAEKVVAKEKGELAEKARSLSYTVQDGTAAIVKGYSHLMEPCQAMTDQWLAAGKVSLTENIEIPFSDWGPDEMIEEAGAGVPSVMLSLSHGLGAPRRGWKTPDHQRALQGAISMGLEDPVTADALRTTPFLPGGIWMAVACFSAGTPASSAFQPWLLQLAEDGRARQQANLVLKSLPAPDARPFVAALPQALLANPNGPLAVIGHMDLAWTFGFSDPTSKKSRASRMFSALRVLMAGSRAGVAMDALMRIYRETNDDLMSHYQLRSEANVRGLEDPVDPKALGRMWMQRNDLRGYVLLGDPAARLPIESTNPALFAKLAPSEKLATPEAFKESAPATSQASLGSEQTQASVPPQASSGSEQTQASVVPQVPSGGEETQAPGPYHPSSATFHQEQRAQPMATNTPEPPASPPSNPVSQATQSVSPPSAAPQQSWGGPPMGAAPIPAMTRPRSLENPQVALRERAVLALIRGDEAPRSIAARFGIPLEELFYWLDVYRESGRRVLSG